MAFRRRKLLNDSLQIIVVESCTQFCDPRKNLDGHCPLTCLPFCFSTCKPKLLLPQDPPPPPPPPNFTALGAHRVKHFRVSLFLIVSLSILATTFLLFSCYTVYKFYRNRGSSGSRRSEQQQGEDDQRFSDLVDEDRGLMVDHPIWHIRTVGLRSSIISAITVCKYKRGEGLVEGTECAVCLNEFQEDETLRLLPKCNHAFHIPCIDTWLRSHTNCPMCRAGIVTNTVAVPATEQSLQTSGPVLENETRAEAPENNNSSSRELIGRERENREGFEERIEIEEVEGEGAVRNGLGSNEVVRGGLVNSAAEEVDEAQIGMRRSFSLDFVSASMVCAAVAKAFAAESGSKSARAEFNCPAIRDVPKKAERLKAGTSSSSSSSSLMPGLMKRSLSCGGKIFSSRYNRKPSAILPR